MVKPTKVHRHVLTNAFCNLRTYITCTKIRNRPDKSQRVNAPLGDICRLRRLTVCWRFLRTYEVLYAKKTAVKTTRGTCQVAHWWRRWDARGDMREDTNIKGADTESDFWLIIYSVAGLTCITNIFSRPLKKIWIKLRILFEFHLN